MKYSIIVPCYKCAKYIRATLDSALAQKVADWEVVCVDDGSPDETGAILDEYAAKDKRMRVIHQENQGVSEARNAGIAVARGEWLVYLDGDDLLSPHALEIVENCIAQVPDADIVECGYVNFNDGEAFDWGERKGRVAAQDVSKVIPSDPFGGCFQRFVFRHETVKGIAYKGVSCTEEMGYMVKSFIRAKTLAKTDDVFYGYRVLAGSMSHRGVSYQLCIDYFDLVRHVTRILVESGKTVPSSIMRSLMNRWGENQVFLISLLARKEDRNNAWTYWWERLPNVVQYKSVCSRWQWVVLMICCRIRLRAIAFLLCWLPHWLKMKGVHR